MKVYCCGFEYLHKYKLYQGNLSYTTIHIPRYYLLWALYELKILSETLWPQKVLFIVNKVYLILFSRSADIVNFLHCIGGYKSVNSFEKMILSNIRDNFISLDGAAFR